ncbi:MAG: ABC transporter permease [Acidimicrobiales bacterium]
MSRASADEHLIREWLWGNTRARLATSFLILVTVLAVAAPLVTTHPPNEQSVTAVLQGPSAEHWLGTDDVGRDVWSRLVYGGRVSLLASVIAVVVAVVVGVPIGLIAGFRGGWVDSALMRVADTLLAFPSIVLAIGVTAALGPGLVNAMVAVGVVFSPSIARIMRGQVLSVRSRSYVEAALTYGSSNTRVIVRHVVPNAIQPVVIQATLMMGLALLAEASLSFLGLGVQNPQPSWGVMLRRAAQFIYQAPNAVYLPGIAIALTVLAFNTLGDSLRDSLDPVEAARRRLRRSNRRRRRAGSAA